MKKLILTSFFLLPLLTGCAFLDFFRKNNDNPTATTEILIDSEILKECDRLPEEFKTALSADELGIQDIRLIGMYGECANKQRKSIAVIKKLTEVK